MNDNSEQSAIRVRQAVGSDCAAMAKLARQLGYESSREQIAARLDEMRRSEERNVLVAETAGGTIVGWIGMYVFRTVTDEPRAEISGLVVDETARSRGIGERLLEAAENWAREKGLRAIGLHCNVIRERAHGFYLRHGYRETKTQKVFQKQLGN